MPGDPPSRLRPALRAVLVWAATILTVPLWLPALLERAWTDREGLFALGSQLLSLVPGLPGIYLRRAYYARTLDGCVTDCHIGFGTTLAHPQVSIGRGVYVGHHCSLGKVVLEDDVTIGSNVDLISGRHQHGYHWEDVPVQA